MAGWIGRSVFVGSGSVFGFHEISVTVVEANNCDNHDTINVYICEHIGIDKRNDKSILSYPNPAENYITINLRDFRKN
jgi:hypothetical protein